MVVGLGAERAPEQLLDHTDLAKVGLTGTGRAQKQPWLNTSKLNVVGMNVIYNPPTTIGQAC